MKKPQPIIVIGLERSGTKWLSNLLCNHSDVIGVQADRHRGILETNMFWQMSRKFDLRFRDDYVAMLELWSKTDFFQQTGIDSRLFFELRPLADSCIVLFEKLMDEFARVNQKDHWLQKANPVEARELVEHFESAHFVVITRKRLAVLQSTVQAKVNAGRSASLLETVYSYVVHEKYLKRILRRVKPVTVTYEGLVENLEGELRRLCVSLGLEFEPGMEIVRFAKNTSFRSEPERQAVFSSYERALLKVLYLAFRVLPLALASRLSALKKALKETEPEPFTSGTFSSLSESKGLARE